MNNMTVCKKLTKNDLGLTGSHQAGICVPFPIMKLDFFPRLDSSLYNPRQEISFLFSGKTVKFTLIYYNSKLFSAGTRNEYRLTGMSKFFRENNCKECDLLEFHRVDGNYSIDIKHECSDNKIIEPDLDRPLIIRSDWAYRRN